jgi:hypothetical protein
MNSYERFFERISALKKDYDFCNLKSRCFYDNSGGFMENAL